MADIGFSIDPNDASDESVRKAEEATRALAAAYRDNDLQQLDFDTELDAAVLGDGVYKVTWDAEEERVRVSAPRRPGHLRLVGRRRREPGLAGGQPLQALP